MLHNIYYFHGWSYTGDFWKGIVPHIPCGEYFFYERGYDYAPNRPVLDTQKRNIAITHSMGLYFLLENYDVGFFEKIIVIAGFSSFPQVSPLANLRIMQRNFKRDALKTLVNFRLLVGDMRELSMHPINTDILNADLEKLAILDYTLQLQSIKDKLYFIEMEHDKIILSPQRDLFKQKYVIKGENHIFQENKELCQTINGWINKI